MSTVLEHPARDLSELRFSKWQPSELMEWAKRRPTDTHTFDLARSGIPAITNIGEIPGGPFVPEVYGHNEWGHEGLKQVLAEMYGAEPENVLLAQGASQSNFLMAGAALADGGTAMVETPMYQPVLRGIQVWADRMLRLPRRKETGYQPDPAELRRMLTKDTRLVMLTNLHNPTHAYLTADTLAAMVEIASEAGAVVVVDEVFHAMVDRDHRQHAFSRGAVSINSLGKSWGLDGLRVGWAIGPQAVVHRAYRLNNLLGVNQPHMTEDLAWRILQSRKAREFLTARAAKAAQGRRLFKSFLESTPEVSCLLPSAGISALVELPAGTNDVDFSEALLAEEQTVVFPASLFECPGAVRVSFGGEEAEVAEGLSRLSRKIRKGL